MRRKIYQLIAASTVFVTALSGCGKEKLQEKEIVRPVRYALVTKSSLAKTRTFSGVSVATKETKISFRISGTLEKLNLKTGQKIKKSALIGSIDDSDIQLKYKEAKAAMLNGGVQKDTAKSNLRRVRELYENDNVSLSEYEKAKNQYAAAKADLESQANRVSLQKSQLSYSKLFSPMDGIVANVLVEQNENVSAGQVIAVLTSDKDIEIEVGIPEAYVSLLKNGDVVSVRFSSAKEQTYPGVITEVSYVTSGASTYPVKISLPEGTSLRPGMAADTTFTFSTENEERILTPVNSVAKDNKGNYVFVVVDGEEKGFGTVLRRDITLGKLSNEGIAVSKGLKENDRVVTSGLSKITDKMKVRVNPLKDKK